MVCRFRVLLAVVALSAATPLVARAACDPGVGGPLTTVQVQGADHVDATAVREAVPFQGGDALKVEDLARVENAVGALGSFAKVTALLEPDGDGCRLVVTVEEYPPVSEIRFVGVTAYPAEELTQALKSRVGEPANLARVKEDAEAIAARYRNDGFDAARVVEVDLTDGIVTFTMDEGHIIRIEVRGAKRTGRRRVLDLLGIKEQDLYNSLELHKAQRTLYRTGLFALVGFGAEPVGSPENPEGIALTVRVEEFVAPSFHILSYADQSTTLQDLVQRERNVRRGHSLELSALIETPPPSDLARTGFDFYYLDVGAEFRQFRPPWRPYNAVTRLSYARTKGRDRPDLGLRYSLDAPLVSGTLAFPIGRNAEGGLAVQGGYYELRPFDLAATNQSPGRRSGAVGRAVLTAEWQLARGLETPGKIEVDSGVEFTDGFEPFGYIHLDGYYGFRLPYGRLKVEAEAGALGGDNVPFWRQFRLGGGRGPAAHARDFTFADRFATTRVAYEIPLFRELVLIRPAWEGALVDGAPESGFHHAAVAEVGIGPDFLRVIGGAAVPLDRSLEEVWWTLSLNVGTPF